MLHHDSFIWLFALVVHFLHFMLSQQPVMHLAIQLILTALMIAIIPLGLVWVSSDQNKYRKLVLVTLFLTFDLIMFGAFTRLTDSGLGCPDWPGCYGAANPLIAHASISAAQQAMPEGPVTHTKAWIEMLHRYLAMTVGVLIVTQMLVAWLKRRQFKAAPWYATALFLCVCIQGAFGMWTVTLKLQPVIVTTHLLLGMGLLAMLAALYARLQPLEPSVQPTQSQLPQPQPQPSQQRRSGAGTGLSLLALCALLLLLVQIALGGWVSTNYAVLACSEYPLCQGALIPDMDFSHGFSLWRQLGKTTGGDYLPFAALTAIHWVHRHFALLVFAVAGYLGWRLRRLESLRKLANLLLLLLGLQLCTGLANILFSWPLVVAVMHNGGAAALLIVLTMVNYRLTVTPAVIDPFTGRIAVPAADSVDDPAADPAVDPGRILRNAKQNGSWRG